MKPKERNSNIELLRCVLMVMLLILHFNGQFSPLPNSKEQLLTGYMSHIQLLVEALTIIVVNTFVLISGYFGIKGVIKKIISLYFICFFYSLIYFFFNTYNTHTISAYGVLDLFLCFTHTPLWFIKSYIALLLFSPILNFVVKNITQKQYNIIILFLTVYNIYMGWFWQEELNTSGYNVMNFIYLYFIGRYINIYKLNLNIKHSSIIYITCCFLIYVMALLCLYIGLEKHLTIHVIAYNNPLIIIASVAFLMIFLNMSVKSKVINWVASSSLAVYIVHSYFWKEIKTFVSNMREDLSLEDFVIFNIIMIVALFIGSILIDKVRMFLLDPLRDWFINRMKGLLEKLEV